MSDRGRGAVAVAGDEVSVRDGQLYINGAAVEEPFIAERPLYEWGPATVPAGMVLVLGQTARHHYAPPTHPTPATS